jgi:hypothetical protein
MADMLICSVVKQRIATVQKIIRWVFAAAVTKKVLDGMKQFVDPTFSEYAVGAVAEVKYQQLTLEQSVTCRSWAWFLKSAAQAHTRRYMPASAHRAVSSVSFYCG